jgi:hypothetical protein
MSTHTTTNSKRAMVEESPGYEEIMFKTRQIAKATWEENMKKVFCLCVDVQSQNYNIHRRKIL